MVICPEIYDIFKYDEEHHSDYYHTLKTYLRNNMQPIATAKELFIHRTTFLYRLDKMTKMFHIDLNNPDKRLMYQLSISLLEQANHSRL
jgi:DNA-binding PucR family transcriptional regulator